MKAQLNFRFDQFSEHLTETLLNLFSSKRLCDVRLIGDDGVPVMVHRVILAAFSRVLNEPEFKLNAMKMRIASKAQGGRNAACNIVENAYLHF